MNPITPFLPRQKGFPFETVHPFDSASLQKTKQVSVTTSMTDRSRSRDPKRRVVHDVNRREVVVEERPTLICEPFTIFTEIRLGI